jgi:hypothetical protein
MISAILDFINFVQNGHWRKQKVFIKKKLASDFYKEKLTRPNLIIANFCLKLTTIYSLLSTPLAQQQASTSSQPNIQIEPTGEGHDR